MIYRIVPEDSDFDRLLLLAGAEDQHPGGRREISPVSPAAAVAGGAGQGAPAHGDGVLGWGGQPHRYPQHRPFLPAGAHQHHPIGDRQAARLRAEAAQVDLGIEAGPPGDQDHLHQVGEAAGQGQPAGAGLPYEAALEDDLLGVTDLEVGGVAAMAEGVDKPPHRPGQQPEQLVGLALALAGDVGTELAQGPPSFRRRLGDAAEGCGRAGGFGGWVHSRIHREGGATQAGGSGVGASVLQGWIPGGRLPRSPIGPSPLKKGAMRISPASITAWRMSAERTP